MMKTMQAQVMHKRPKHYVMETVVVINKLTGRKSYYMMVCGALRKIGKDDHDKIARESVRASCMSSVGAVNPASKYIRHYTTWHFEFN